MDASQFKIQPSTKCDLLQKIAEDLSAIESRTVVKYGDVGESWQVRIFFFSQNILGG